MPFLTHLTTEKVLYRNVWILLEDFTYIHKATEHLNFDFSVTARKPFYCDFASIPRIPIIFEQLGNRFQEEGTIHDWTYRKDGFVTLSDGSQYLLTKDEADRLLYDMLCENPTTSEIERREVYNGVVIGGESSFHKKKVEDKL